MYCANAEKITIITTTTTTTKILTTANETTKT
jgi:hypothetical protein